MRNAVLNRQAVLNRRAVLDRNRREVRARGVVGDIHRRPRSGSLEDRSARIGVSQAGHGSGDPQVTWRMVAASVLVTAGVLVGLVILGQIAAAGGAGISSATEVIQVGEGETLTELASRISPDSPTSEVIDRIMELNAMSGAGLHTGQNLIVPVGQS